MAEPSEEYPVLGWAAVRNDKLETPLTEAKDRLREIRLTEPKKPPRRAAAGLELLDRNFRRLRGPHWPRPTFANTAEFAFGRSGCGAEVDLELGVAVSENSDSRDRHDMHRVDLTGSFDLDKD